MFQSYVLSQDNSNYRSFGKGDPCSIRVQPLNSTLFPEGEGVTATSLGQRPSVGGKYLSRDLKIIHRVPSVEGATATSLGTLPIPDTRKEINRKNAPSGLSNCNIYKTKRIDHGA